MRVVQSQGCDGLDARPGLDGALTAAGNPLVADLQGVRGVRQVSVSCNDLQPVSRVETAKQQPKLVRAARIRAANCLVTPAVIAISNLQSRCSSQTSNLA